MAKKINPRVKTGLAGIPLDSFMKARFYIHYELDRKPTSEIVKGWIKSNFNRSDTQAILANGDYHFNMHSLYATGIIWQKNNLQLPENISHLFDNMKNYYHNLIETGKAILKEKAEEVKTQEKYNIAVLTPQQRLQQKVNATIMVDLDELEDEWMNGTESEFDLYNRMRLHDLKGAAVDIVRQRIQLWQDEYNDAYNKSCDQAVEAYSHVQRKELKRRLKITKGMLDDLDKLKATSKAVRTRVSKPKPADKQVTKVKFCKENSDYKLASINPVLIVGAMRLYTFNVKTRAITEYVSDSTSGFEISGTSIKKFNPTLSRQTRLRKPDEVLPDVLSKTVRQIDKVLSSLSTKMSSPNGRLNEDTIILRALDR